MKPSLLVSLALAVLLLPACGLLHSTQFPQDVLAEYTCVQNQVETGDTNVATIMAACLIQEEKIVEDAISGLLSSPKWVGEHPDKVPVMKVRLSEMRAKRAASS